MTLQEGVLAAIVREGDYLVFRVDGGGLGVEYSPDAPPGARVVGAFAAKRGKVKYWSDIESAKFLSEYPVETEGRLVAEFLGTDKGRKTLTDSVIAALKAYADAGYVQTKERPRWDGKLSDFHQEVFYPALGLPYSSNIIRAVKRASVRVPGVEVGKSETGDLLVTVDWPEIAHESHS